MCIYGELISRTHKISCGNDRFFILSEKVNFGKIFLFRLLFMYLRTRLFCRRYTNEDAPGCGSFSPIFSPSAPLGIFIIKYEGSLSFFKLPHSGLKKIVIFCDLRFHEFVENFFFFSRK